MPEDDPAEAAPAGLRVEVARRLEELDPHERAWNVLASSLPQVLPLLTCAWVRGIFETEIQAPASWIALFAYRGRELVGVLAGELTRARVAGLPRTVLAPPCRYRTRDCDLVLHPAHAAEALGALLDEARRRIPRLLHVQLGSVRADSPTQEALRSLPRGWFAVREHDGNGASWILEDGYDAWYGGLSKNLKSDLRRTRNKALKDGLGEAVVTFLAGDDADPDLLDDLLRIEATGWKGAAGTALGTTEENIEKYRRRAHRFASYGALEWHRLELGGRLAAMHMAVRMGDKLMLLRQGLEQDLRAYGPGNHLIRAMVEREFGRLAPGAAGEVNLVTGYPWCRRWRMRETSHDAVRIGRRTMLPLLIGGLPLGFRNLVRRVPGARRLAHWWRDRGSARSHTPRSR